MPSNSKDRPREVEALPAESEVNFCSD